jgi:hypothetical protein
MKQSAESPAKEAQSWRKAYTLTLAFFALEVVLLYLFTIRFS